MNPHVWASKIMSHQLSTMTSLLCRVESGGAPQQQSAISGPTERQGSVKMKPRHRAVTLKWSEAGTGGRGRGEENKILIAKLSWKWQQKLLCLAFESITVVCLSTYHSASVNAVSPISYKKVCVCAVRRPSSVWLSVTMTVFLISSLSLLSCLPGLNLSLKSMSLFPTSFEENADSRPQNTSVKWKGTDNKRDDEVVWRNSEKEED